MTGLYFTHGKWEVRFSRNKETLYFGRFADKSEAEEVCRKALRRYPPPLKATKEKQSGTPGVTWSHGRWLVKMSINGKPTNFGYFYNKKKAEKLAVKVREENPVSRRKIRFDKLYDDHTYDDEILFEYAEDIRSDLSDEARGRVLADLKAKVKRIRQDEARMIKAGIDPRFMDEERGKTCFELEEMGII